ncbi:trehalose-phosphatase [Roseisolibacter sp. H3M3-2]|uniref:trehalose-phosphatase n=1 Tax=Roseisolibacter sp. H3M3-2 TaxID=3031323 RepID=UPI0023DA466B|nr:trehalose-phosphatase [Roseisolibacter sp. H3M3-2]MDF1501665.1 trehalose-phosphatase [Roseisolibacter sp. H3M3-2]
MSAPLADDALAPLAQASPLLALFDIDGTLAPLAPRPELAEVPDATRRALADLAARPGVRVGLVTGRAAHDGARMVPAAGLWVIGNHGVETWDADGTRRVAEALVAAAAAVAREAAALASPVAAVPGALLEDKRWGLSVHTRLAPDDAVPALADAVRDVAAREGLRVHDGKRILELRPDAELDKGTAVLALAARLGALAPAGAVLFAGDDRTDEDAFRRLRAAGARAVTIRVGEADVPTEADWHVASPVEVAALIGRLVELRGPVAERAER